jgi:hypothetical protein
VPTPSCDAFRRVAIEIREFSSVPLRSADKTVRLAARTLNLRVQVAPDEWPTDPGLTGHARLPAPLSRIAGLFPQTSVTGQAIAELATLAAAPAAVPPLAGVHLFANLNSPPPQTEPQADLHGLMLGDAP